MGSSINLISARLNNFAYPWLSQLNLFRMFEYTSRKIKYYSKSSRKHCTHVRVWRAIIDTNHPSRIWRCLSDVWGCVGMCGDAPWPDHRCGFHRVHMKLRTSVCKDESESGNMVGLLPQDKILQAGHYMGASLSTSFIIYKYVFIYTYICRYKNRCMYTHTYIVKMVSLQEISSTNNCLLGKIKKADVL